MLYYNCSKGEEVTRTRAVGETRALEVTEDLEWSLRTTTLKEYNKVTYEYQWLQ